MRRRWIALVVAVCSLACLIGCGAKAGDVSSVERDYATADRNVVYIDEDAIALASSIASADMTEAEVARAAELDQMARDVFALMNAERTAKGLKALVWSDEIAQAGLVRAEEIAVSFSHTRPNGSDWYTVNSDLLWGENLAKGFKTASGVVNGWMKSKAHKANIMKTSFTTGAITIYEAADGTLYFASEFGY